MGRIDALISKADIASVGDVSDTVKEEIFLPFIRSAQDVDVKPVIGNVGWTYILKNKDTEEVQALLDGGEYEYSGSTYSFTGLRYALAHFAYSRYMVRRSVKDTRFGAVVKTTDVSEPADYKALAAIARDHSATAVAYLNEVLEYMRRNSDKFQNIIGEGKKETPRGPVGIHFVDRFER